MEKKRVTFSAKIQPLEKLNDEFLKCKVYVCALGKNRNFSYISRGAADKALFSLFNIPVIGHLYEDEDGKLHMGGHDMVVEKTQEGKYVYKSLCVPYGVVPQQENIHYEDIQEPNGDIKTYVVGYCLLWVGRFPELLDAVYTEDWLFSQSMEINVEDYAPLDEDKNYTNILTYTYSALCLLGRSDDKEYNVEPCFPESHVAASYEFENDNRFMALMKEFKNDLSKYFGKNDGEEGEKIMTKEMIESLLKEFDVAENELPFEISESITPDELRSKIEEFVNARNNEETVIAASSADSQEPEVQPEPERTFTYREKAEAISKALPSSDNVYYWVCDFDDKYVYVEREYWGDAYVCDKGRFEYSYDESTREASISGDFEVMFVTWLTQSERDLVDAMRGQYEELKAYKEQREQRDREDALDAVLESFSDLAGNEEYEAIVENKYSYSDEDALRNACYIVRGKFGLIAKPHKNNDITVPIGTPRAETMTPREKLHANYGKR